MVDDGLVVGSVVVAMVNAVVASVDATLELNVYCSSVVTRVGKTESVEVLLSSVGNVDDDSDDDSGRIVVGVDAFDVVGLLIVSGGHGLSFVVVLLIAGRVDKRVKKIDELSEELEEKSVVEGAGEDSTSGVTEENSEDADVDTDVLSKFVVDDDSVDLFRSIVVAPSKDVVGTDSVIIPVYTKGESVVGMAVVPPGVLDRFVGNVVNFGVVLCWSNELV